MLRSRITLPIALAFLIGTFTPIIAQADGNVLYYILDASGSMWQRVEGKPRIPSPRKPWPDC